jgi:transposase
LIAAEQQRPDVVQKREQFKVLRQNVEPSMFVFLDESGAKTNMTRAYGRAAKGQRCVDHTPSGHWQTMTMLSAIGVDHVLEQASVVIDGSVNGSTFLQYVQEHLVPALTPGQVVVMDNFSSHKVPGVREAIQGAECELWYLPPYSPDLNPIEKLWSKVKTHLRQVCESTFKSVSMAVGQALKNVTADECKNYFISCGYVD